MRSTPVLTKILTAAAGVTAAAVLVGCGGAQPVARNAPSGVPSITLPSNTPVTGSSSEPPSSIVPDQTDAESVCAEVYADRGAAPHAESGDVDDDMALVSDWQSDLVTHAVTQVRDAGAGSVELLDLMEEYADLAHRAASIYNTHPMFSNELTQIEDRTSRIQDEIPGVAASAGAPSCADLVTLSDG